MTKIAQRELRNQVSEILRRAEAGERFTITVSGRPVAELGPLVEPRRFASPESLARIFEESPVGPSFAEDIERMREEDRRNAVDVWRD